MGMSTVRLGASPTSLLVRSTFSWEGRVYEKDQVYERTELRTAARLRGRPGRACGLGVKGDIGEQFSRAAGAAIIAAAAAEDHGGTERKGARGSEEPAPGRRPFTCR